MSGSICEYDNGLILSLNWLDLILPHYSNHMKVFIKQINIKNNADYVTRLIRGSIVGDLQH